MYSLSIRCMVASAAARHTGFPPNVVPCAPGFQRITLSLAIIAPSGMPFALPLELFEDFRAAGFRGVAVRAAISVRIGDVFDSTEQRAESLAVRRFRRCERKGTHRATVEAAVKRDELVALCGVSRQFDGAFYCLGLRIGEKDLLAFRARHRPAEPLRQLRHALIIKISTGHVNQLGRLL